GHNLVWHQQTSAWVFQGTDGKPADRETLLARMRDHIHTVVGRYKGRIHGWDVVNEAIDEDGSLRKAPWHDGIGDDYVAKAFEFAHEADPDAELYYNDYNLEKPAKRAGVIRLVKDLKARGLRIDGIGNQGHWRLETPTIGEIEDALVDLHSTGLKVMYTELDINLLPQAGRDADPAVANPYASGLPDDKQRELAARYADIFGVFMRHRDIVTRVTFWGLSDADSWLNRGRMNYPLLWDRLRQPKPAFQGVVDVLKRARKKVRRQSRRLFGRRGRSRMVGGSSRCTGRERGDDDDADRDCGSNRQLRCLAHLLHADLLDLRDVRNGNRLGHHMVVLLAHDRDCVSGDL